MYVYNTVVLCNVQDQSDSAEVTPSPNAGLGNSAACGMYNYYIIVYVTGLNILPALIHKRVITLRACARDKVIGSVVVNKKSPDPDI